MMLHLNLIPPQLAMPYYAEAFQYIKLHIISFLAAFSREGLTVNLDTEIIFSLSCVRAGRFSDEEGFKRCGIICFLRFTFDSITFDLTRCKDLNSVHLFQSI